MGKGFPSRVDGTFGAFFPAYVFPSFPFLSLPSSPCFIGLADKIWVSASSGSCHRPTADAGGAHQGHHCHAAVWGARGDGGPRSVAHVPSSLRCRGMQGWLLAGPGRRGDLVLSCGVASSPGKAHTGVTYGPVYSCKSNYMAQVLCCLVLSRT